MEFVFFPIFGLALMDVMLQQTYQVDVDQAFPF